MERKSLITVLAGLCLTTVNAHGQSPCLEARVTVECDVDGEVQQLSHGPYACEPPAPPENCCMGWGEALRVQCHFSGGKVLGTECECLRAVPALSVWGVIVLSLLIVAAATVIARRRQVIRAAAL